MLFDIILGAALLLSLGLNALLFFKLKKKSERPMEVGAEELLHYLTRDGRAVLNVKCIDPSGLFIYNRVKR